MTNPITTNGKQIMKQIEINNRKIILVEVPEDAEDFHFTGGDTPFTSFPDELYLGVRFPKGQGGENIGLGISDKEDVEILGYTTLSEVSFDCSRLVEFDSNGASELNGCQCYKDYLNEERCFTDPDNSFRSLIEKETGKFFSNPLGENDFYRSDIDEIDHHAKNEYDIEWQQAEAERLKKVVVIEVKSESKVLSSPPITKIKEA